MNHQSFTLLRHSNICWVLLLFAKSFSISFKSPESSGTFMVTQMNVLARSRHSYHRQNVLVREVTILLAMIRFVPLIHSLIFVRYSPWDLQDHLFFSFFFRDRFKNSFNYFCVPLDLAIVVQDYTTKFVNFNSSAGIPRVGISAVFCFILMYLNDTSVSLMISVIRSLTITDVFYFCFWSSCIHWEPVHNTLSTFSNLIVLAKKRRLLVPVSTHSSSSLVMLGFFNAITTPWYWT